MESEKGASFPTRQPPLSTRTKIEIEAEGTAAQYQLQRTTLSHEQLADAESAFMMTEGRPLGSIVSHYLKLHSDIQSRTGLTLDQARAGVHLR